MAERLHLALRPRSADWFRASLGLPPPRQCRAEAMQVGIIGPPRRFPWIPDERTCIIGFMFWQKYSRRTALVLCHDEITSTFDRRISQQIDCLIHQGWSVVLIGFSSETDEEIWRMVGRLTVLTLPVSKILPCDDPKWRELHGGDGSRRGFGLASLRTKLTYAAASQRNLVKRLFSKVERLSGIKATTGLKRFKEKSRLLGSLAEFYPLLHTETLYRHGRNIEHDMVICNDLTTARAGLQLSDLADSVLVYDAHELYPEQVAFSRKQKELLNYWEGKVLRRADLSLTISEAAASFLREKHGLDRDIKVLTNAPDFETMRTGPGKLRAAIRDPDSFLMLYHGRASGPRNVDILMEGFRQAGLERVTLVLMGTDFEDDGVAKDTAGGERIVRLPPVPADDLAAWVGDVDAVLIPYPAVDRNTELCAPNKLFDALALSVPVIANEELVNVRTILEKYRAGTCIPMANPQEVAAHLPGAIETIRSGEPDFEAAQEDLGWETQKRQYLSWIDELFEA